MASLPFLGEKVRARDAAAIEFARRVIRNARMMNAFNRMPNMNRAAINKAFHTWATAVQLSPAARNALHQALNVRSKDEFLRHIIESIEWITKHLGDRPYALIVEVNEKNSTFTAKSSAWLGGPTVRAIGRQPSAVIPFYRGQRVAARPVAAALDRGIRDFVHVDDAMYSGLQKETLVDEMYALLKKARVSERPTLWIAVAYTTPAATALVKRAASRASKVMDVVLVAPGTIRNPAENLPPNVVTEVSTRTKQTVGPSMTVLPFKVPNSVSFGPEGLATQLELAVQKPVYKRINVTHPSSNNTIFQDTNAHVPATIQAWQREKQRLLASPPALLRTMDTFVMYDEERRVNFRETTYANNVVMHEGAPVVVWQSMAALADEYVAALAAAKPTASQAVSYIEANLARLIMTKIPLKPRRMPVSVLLAQRVVTAIDRLTMGMRLAVATNTAFHTKALQVCAQASLLNMHANTRYMLDTSPALRIADRISRSDPGRRAAYFGAAADQMLLFYASYLHASHGMYFWLRRIVRPQELKGALKLRRVQEHVKEVLTDVKRTFLNTNRHDDFPNLAARCLVFVIAMDSYDVLTWFIRSFGVNVRLGPHGLESHMMWGDMTGHTSSWVALAMAWGCTKSVRALRESGGTGSSFLPRPPRPPPPPRRARSSPRAASSSPRVTRSPRQSSAQVRTLTRQVQQLQMSSPQRRQGSPQRRQGSPQRRQGSPQRRQQSGRSV
jgi:hypothetical protein